jgi:probable HAF family extracellular repeat protein
MPSTILRSSDVLQKVEQTRGKYPSVARISSSFRRNCSSLVVTMQTAINVHRWLMVRSRTLAGVSAGLAIATTVGVAAATYSARDLGTLGGVSSFPLDVNDDGVVVGYSETPSGSTHAFRWTRSEGMDDLGTLGGNFSVATAVNGSGVVVGASITAGGYEHAFAWIDKIGMLDIGTLAGGFTSSYATGINDKAVVIGFSSKTVNFETQTRGFAWARGRGMVDIGTFGGDTYPNAVNTKGVVVGTSYTFGNASSRPFAWTRNGGIVDLGSFGGQFGEALAVNDNGMIVGYSYTAGNVSYPRPFAWTEATGMVDLGVLGSGNGAYAVALNNKNVVVGYSATVGNEVLRAFKWTAFGGLVDLGTLGGNDSYATGVNDDGVIVGNNYTADGQGLQGFVLSPANGMMTALTGPTYSQLGKITATGTVMGFGYGPGGFGHATIWTPDASGPLTTLTVR